MSIPLTQQLQEDMKMAMRAKEADRLIVIREIIANIKKKLIDSPDSATNRTDLPDGEVLAIIQKMIKQRQDSIEQFTKGDRPELAAKEQNELNVLQAYLPAALSEAEIITHIKNAINECQASTIKDMGKVMNLLRPKLQGRADMAVVSQRIKELLV